MSPISRWLEADLSSSISSRLSAHLPSNSTSLTRQAGLDCFANSISVKNNNKIVEWTIQQEAQTQTVRVTLD